MKKYIKKFYCWWTNVDDRYRPIIKCIFCKTTDVVAIAGNEQKTLYYCKNQDCLQSFACPN